MVSTSRATEKELRSIGESILIHNQTLRKSLHQQIQRADDLEEQLIVTREHLQRLAETARAFCMDNVIDDMPFCHALADALAYMKGS